MEALAWLARTHAAVLVGASVGMRRSGVPTSRGEREIDYKDKAFNSMQFKGAYFSRELLLSRKDLKTSLGSRGASGHKGVMATQGLGASGRGSRSHCSSLWEYWKGGHFFLVCMENAIWRQQSP
jgi:hypothetical protein